MVKIALTVGGSDSGGGAGIQADLKTFAALGVHGVCAIAALTVQNSVSVKDTVDIPGYVIEAQIDALAEDMSVDAMKTGMLPNRDAVEAVAGRVQAHSIGRLVVDPVLAASSGRSLLTEDGLEALRTSLLSAALVVTPNRRETEVLAGVRLRGDGDIAEAARRILDMGPRYVLIKGGHAEGDAVDWLCSALEMIPYRASRISTRNTHGTGCTLSAAITAYLALGNDVPDAVKSAKQFVTEAIRHGYTAGQGPGPVNQLFALHPRM